MAITRRTLCVVSAFLVALTGLVMSPIAAAQEVGAPTVLITGSNRGIGFEFVKQYAADDWRVIATCRKPGDADDLKNLAADYPLISIEELDITDPEEIAALATKYEGEPIDLLLNNAGYGGNLPTQNLGTMDYDQAQDLFNINALGALRVSEAFIDHVALSEQKKIIAITSLSGSTGSIGDSKLIAYRAAKAALNSMMRNISFGVADRGISVGILAPGIVDSMGLLDMEDEDIPDEWRPLAEAVKSGVYTMQRTPDAVTAMRIVIDNLSLETSGVFFDYDGSTLPW